MRANTSSALSSAPAATSSARVAHAGKGNCTSSGTGTSGCCRNILPGFRIDARTRAEVVRKPYSSRCDSGRVEPADDAERRVRRHAALDLARRLLRADQDDAEAAAALGDVEHDLLDRAAALARRVLVQLVQHEEDEGVARRRAPSPPSGA